MRWLLLAVLMLAGSCAPERRPLVSQAIPERPASLLKRLALDVPDDVARLPLVASGADEHVSAIAAAPAFLDAARSDEDAARARDCLTAAIYYEARSESIDGQRAVAQVVLNRVRDRAFPSSICGVVFQGSERRTGCQFSFTCDGSMDRPRNADSWSRAGLVAAAALSGEVYAPVGSATHYHTTAISPWWAPSLTRLTTVGAHVFYRWPQAMERALAFRQRYLGYEPAVAAGGSDMAAEMTGGGEQAFGVTVHRGGMFDEGAASAAAAPKVAAATPARFVTVAGVRVHKGIDMAAGGDDDGGLRGADWSGGDARGVRVHRSSGGDQPSSNPTPIEARAASASLETTG